MTRGQRRLTVLLGLALVAGACGSSTDGATEPGDQPLATTTTTTGPTTTTTTLVLETTEAPTIAGVALPRFGDTPDPALGLTAPTVTGSSFDGSALSIEPSGNYTVIVFVAHWCPHCQSEVKSLGPYLTTSPPADNIDVVAVSTGVDPQRPNYPPAEWLTPEAWPHPVLADSDDGAMANAYGLNAYPFWVVLDPTGTVIARTAGSLPPESVETLFSNLSQLQG